MSTFNYERTINGKPMVWSYDLPELSDSWLAVVRKGIVNAMDDKIAGEKDPKEIERKLGVVFNEITSGSYTFAQGGKGGGNITSEAWKVLGFEYDIVRSKFKDHKDPIGSGCAEAAKVAKARGKKGATARKIRDAVYKTATDRVKRRNSA